MPYGRLPLASSHAITAQKASDTSPAAASPQEGTEILQGVWYESRAGVSRQSDGGITPDGTGAAAASAGTSHGSEIDMDELARNLYDRIRTRLKSELLVDRERAGFLTDLR
jgi:hypothetical protein